MTEDIITTPCVEGLPFNIAISGTSYCDGSYKIIRPHSDITCVEYIVSGCGVVHCGTKTVYPREGDMYILPKNADHFYYSDSSEPWVKIWFNAFGDLPLHILAAYGLNRRILFENCDGGAFIRRIHSLCKNRTMPPSEIQSACASEFFALMQFMAATVNTGAVSDADIIREYIDSNADRILSLDDIAAQISKSPSQTIRIFKKSTGMTPYEYHLVQKINKSKLLLKSSNMSIKEIAAALSFSDEHYFSGLFRKKTGLSPSEYRRFERF